MKEIILNIYSLCEKKVYNIYHYGSFVYDTMSMKSDYDFILVVDECDYNYNESIEKIFKDININVTFLSREMFKSLLHKHEISILECYFLPEKFKLKEEYKPKFELKLNVLRHSISQKSSNSYVKCKKKIIDGENYIAQKSIFHSIRMIDFAIQICKYNKIVEYDSMVNLWFDIKSTDIDWLVYKDKYHNMRNKLLSEFRILAPK